MLGLPHAYTNEEWAEDNWGCFNFGVWDYHRNSRNDVWWGCPTDSTYGNNLMNIDAGCMQNLSPGQMAVMHYNLQTRFAQCLVPASYSFATDCNPGALYVVTQDETWAEPKYMRGDITVKSGKTLSITCQVAMTHGAKIILEHGSQLVVSGGTITNLAGRAWDGIYVHGKPVFSHSSPDPNNPGCIINQGVVRLKNGAVISHARVGVRDHGLNFIHPTGLIFASDARFIDNQYDVFFYDPPTPYVNLSSFSNCTFTVSGIIGDNLKPQARIGLCGARGVKIFGCKFGISGTAYVGNEGTGIGSFNSSFIVAEKGSAPTQIKNFRKGIWVANSNPLAIPSISGTHLIGNEEYGAYFQNVHNFIFHNNYIENVSSPGCKGLYLDRCRHYKIRSNTFTEASTANNSAGIDVYQSYDGGHEVYRNNFKNLFMGINVFDNNNSPPNTTSHMASTTGLKMNCNNFQPGQGFQTNMYDIALTYTPNLTAPSINRVQGVTAGAPSGTLLVRNIYDAQSSSCSDGNMYHAHSTFTMTIEHGSNTNSVTAITQPPVACKSSQINVVDMGKSLNYDDDCPGSTASSGGNHTSPGDQLLNLNTYASALRAEADTGADVSYELQSTISTKLNCFLTDTNGLAVDSVLAIYDQDQGGHSDPQIMAIFVHILEGQLTEADALVAVLGTSYEGWALFFEQYIGLLQTDEGLAGLATNQDAIDVFTTLAETENGQAQAASIALLQSFAGYNYTPPHPVPGESTGERRRGPGNSNEENNALLNPAPSISIYPNPTDGSLNIDYIYDAQTQATAELRDPLGRVLCSKKLMIGHNTFALGELSGGLYFVIIADGAGNTLHRASVVKQQ